MLLQWTVVAILPYVVTCASLGEFLSPVAAESSASLAEDPPPHNFIPSIERIYQYDEIPVDGNPTYENLEIVDNKLDFSTDQEAFAARRRNLQKFLFTIEPKGRLKRDLYDQEYAQQSRKTRQNKAFKFPAEETGLPEGFSSGGQRHQYPFEFSRNGESTGYVSGVGRRHRSKRGASAPAVDAVDDNPAQWRRFDNKPQFVTSRNQPAAGQRMYYQGAPQHRVAHNMDENDVHNMRYNEIPPSPPLQREPARYQQSQYVREPITDYRREGEPSKRIIYYANLPEVSRGRPIEPVDYRRDRGYDDRYDYSRAYSKYPRESRYEDTNIRQGGRDDRYRYRPPGNSGSYAIIDAERPPPPQNGYPHPNSYRDPDASSRYNRIPAPYQQSQPGGRYPYDQRRGAPPPAPLGSERPNAALHPSRYNPYGRTNSNAPRSQLTVTPTNPAGEELYRDYNPRQPAPWSLQIGTKLTVKDDGRPMPSPGGQRFYVQSQQQQQHQHPHPQQQYPSRYLRSEDDPDTRQI
ncbi:hypothetical protein C0J52_06601 [Blattella germanica]|nr:hypothetical protein C0J52_06601 [Blattella germanica]